MMCNFLKMAKSPKSLNKGLSGQCTRALKAALTFKMNHNLELRTSMTAGCKATEEGSMTSKARLLRLNPILAVDSTDRVIIRNFKNALF